MIRAIADMHCPLHSSRTGGLSLFVQSIENISMKMAVVSFVVYVITFSVAGAELPPLPSGKAAFSLSKPTSMEEAKTFNPRFVGKGILCGNKKLSIDPAGDKLILTQDGEVLANYYCVIMAKDVKTGKVRWVTPWNKQYFDGTKRTVSFKDKRYISDNWMKFGGMQWHARHMEIEIQPNGSIRVSQQLFAPPKPGIVELSGIHHVLRFTRQAINGKTMTINGSSTEISPQTKRFSTHADGGEIAATFYDGDAERQFGLTARKGSGLRSLSVKPEADQVLCQFIGSHDNGNPDRLTHVFDIDIRRGVVNEQAQDTRGGINFRRVEGIEMPDISSGNFVRNPSFEEGMKDYFIRFEGTIDNEAQLKTKWKTEFFTLDDQVAMFGRHSLKMVAATNPNPRDVRSLRYTPNLSLSPMVLSPGVYTFSFYVKGDVPDMDFKFWITGLRSSTLYTAIKQTEQGYRSTGVVPVTDTWQRHSVTLRVPMDDAVFININAIRASGTGHVWVDGLQLEAGDQAQAFRSNPVEGELITSDPDNFIEAGEAINARLRLTAPPNAKGKALVQVKNFLEEGILEAAIDFQADANGHAVIQLPFDCPEIGKGLFMVRVDFELADDRKCFSQYRFAVADFLDGTHKHRYIFANTYGSETPRHDIDRRLDRYRKLGIAGASEFGASVLPIEDGAERQKYYEYGIATDQYGLFLPVEGRGGFSVRFPGGRFKDHKRSGREPDDAYFADFKEAVKKRVKANSHIRIWEFANEFFAAFPVSWWSEKHDVDEAYDLYARYLKAYVEGVKEVNPSAIVMPDSTYNMNQTGGIVEKDHLLRACNKLGFKFDAIACHTYRPAPENPDLDTDMQSMIANLVKHGYSEKTPFYFSEGMHWGPYEIPAWTLQSSRWAHTPTTWPNQSSLSYDIGQTERRSAAWRARSWLVALKYGDQVLQMNSGNANNFDLDIMMTPRVSQLVSNTLANLLGNADFRRDVRFAPFVRAYVFEDEQQRPVAAIWCHKKEVDLGYDDAPIAKADFGDTLESVIDLMNQPRAFTPGELRFPVMSTPLFLRGRKGTLAAMVAALEHASIVSGVGIAPIHTVANPISPDRVRLGFKNFVSRDFKGTIEGHTFAVPGGGEGTLELPLPTKLTYDRETDEKLIYTMRGEDDVRFDLDVSFTGILVKKVSRKATLATLDWSALPQVALTSPYKTPGRDFKAAYRLGWSEAGIFVEVTVKDPVFSHHEFETVGNRWDNDSLQVYFDALADARGKEAKGSDHNDYGYDIYPNSAGTRSIVYRNYTADQQETLGIYAPKDKTVAKDIPSSFNRTESGYTYRVFFPAKYLLPASMKKGHVMGIGFCVNDANDDTITRWLKRRVGALTNSVVPGEDGWNKPHDYPAALLWE